MINEIKTMTITEKGQIVIPKSIRDRKGFKIGNKIAMITFDDYIELRPMSGIIKNMETAFATEKVLAKDWNNKIEDKAWKSL